MLLDTIRFGQVEIDEKRIITFDDGIPGLEEYHRYALLEVDASYPIVWLQSIEDGSISLPVMDTFTVLPDYVFDLDDEDVKSLGIEKTEDLHVVTVLVIPEDVQKMTANLAAPITININSGKAKQIILSGTEYNVRTPVFQNIREAILRKEGDADVGSVQKAE